MKKIIVWQLGHIGDSVETSVFPTPDMIQALRNRIQEAVDSPTDYHLIWGPDLKVTEVIIEE